MEELIKQYKVSLGAVHDFKKVLLDMQGHIGEVIRDFNILLKLMESEIKIIENNNENKIDTKQEEVSENEKK